jgi:hypothetical protein
VKIDLFIRNPKNTILTECISDSLNSQFFFEISNLEEAGKQAQPDRQLLYTLSATEMHPVSKTVAADSFDGLNCCASPKLMNPNGLRITALDGRVSKISAQPPRS